MARSTNRPGAPGALALALLAVGAVATAGCGDRSTPGPDPRPPLEPGSFFVPVRPPLSADTAGIVSPATAPALAPARSTTTSRVATTSGPALNYWFFLVNGKGLPEPPAPGDARPPLTSPPYVLTLNGAAPAGAAAPNGGTTVGLEPLDSGSPSGAQLWRAVEASDGTAHLRSAASFNVNQQYPVSMIVGYGASSIPLDLGSLAGASPAIYLNQPSPVVPDDSFLEWSYSAATAQLTSVGTGGQLAYGSPTAVVSPGLAPSPENEWYAFPNYMLVRALNQPDSDPPFPAAAVASTPYGETDVAGMQAAYHYVSAHVLPGQPLPSCTYGGVAYTGIRCLYVDLTATSQIQTCASDLSGWSGTEDELTASNPGSYDGTTISLADWYAVVTQLGLECQYAADVQTTFNTYDEIFTEVFLTDSDTLPSLGTDLGLSSEQSVGCLPLAILDAIAYVALDVTLDALDGAGAVLDVLSMGLTAATRSSSGSGLQQEIRTTVADLYSDLANEFEVLTDQTANGANAVLSDWGRLRVIGPLAGVTGYNGLGIDSAQEAAIKQLLVQSYEVAAMQTLLPLAYGLDQWPGLTASAWTDVPSYDQYATSTFGTSTGSYTVSFFENVSTPGNYPSSTVLQDDILDNGANPFELFNGLNGWSAVPAGSAALDCSTVVTTLFNATPNELRVVVDPSQGYVAAPGANFCPICTTPEGSTASYTAELRPHGWVTIFSGADGNDLTTSVEVFDDASSTTSSVASFDLGSDGCRGDSPTNAWDVLTIEGYAFQPTPEAAAYPAGSPNTVAQSKDAGTPGGLWLTLYQP